MEAAIKNQRKEIMSPESTFNPYSYKLKAKQYKDRNDDRWHYRNYRTEEFLIHFLQDGQPKVARGHFIIKNIKTDWFVEGVGFTAYRNHAYNRSNNLAEMESKVDADNSIEEEMNAPQYMDAELFRNHETTRWSNYGMKLFPSNTLKECKERIARSLDMIDGELTFVGGVFNIVNDGNTIPCPHLVNFIDSMTSKDYVVENFGEDMSGLDDMKAIAYLDDETMNKLEFTNRTHDDRLKSWSWGVKAGETLNSNDYSNIVWTYNRHIANKRNSNLPERFDILRAAAGRGLSHPVQLLNIPIPQEGTNGRHVEEFNNRKNRGLDTNCLY